MYLLSFCFFLFLIFILIISLVTRFIIIFNKIFFFIHSKKEFQSEIYERHQKTQWAKNARIITSRAEINLFRKKNSLHNLAYASKKFQKTLIFSLWRTKTCYKYFALFCILIHCEELVYSFNHIWGRFFNNFFMIWGIREDWGWFIIWSKK